MPEPHQADADVRERLHRLKKIHESAALVYEGGDAASCAVLLAFGHRAFRETVRVASTRNEETARFLEAFLRASLSGIEEDERWVDGALADPSSFSGDERALVGCLDRFEERRRLLERALRGLLPPVSFLNAAVRRRGRHAFRLIAAVAMAAAIVWAVEGVRYRHNGLAGQYFPDVEFKGSPVERRDAQIDFLWYKRQPFRGFPADNFSVRWTGSVEVPTDGAITFATVSDDGVRLWIDDRLVIDDWNAHGSRLDEAPLTLSAGRHALKLEYFEGTADAIIQLFWQKPGGQREIIPRSRLFIPE